MRSVPEARGGANREAVVVLAGPPCSLKSTQGQWLAGEMPGVHLEVDKILSAILPQSDRCLQDRLLAYGVAARAIKPVLSRRLSAILDCTYSRKEVRRQVIEWIDLECCLTVIEFKVTPRMALARFNARAVHDAVDLTPEILADRASNYPYGFGTACVDSEASEAEIRESILRALGSEVQLDRERWVQAGV